MNFIRFRALAYKEISRFTRVMGQTLLAPVVTGLLYFFVFGQAIGSNLNLENGVSYMLYIIPGIILLQSCTHAFSNPSSSMVISKYHGNISDILMPPLSPLDLTLGYMIGGILRGMIVGIVLWAIGAIFVGQVLPMHPFWFLYIFIMTNACFSLLGTIWGIYSDTFDKMTALSSFMITPMAFLGCTFYGFNQLSSLAQKLTFANPFFYFVDSAKWAFFEGSDIMPIWTISLITGIFILLFGINYWMFAIGYKLKG